MERMKCPWIVLAALAWLLVAAHPALAEVFLDAYAGAAITPSHDITSEASGVKTTLGDVAFDTAVTFGARFSYWFEDYPYLGLALDVSHFRPNISSQAVTSTALGVGSSLELGETDLAVTAFALDVMLRWPLLVTKEFPNGRLQPYFTLGPALFVARIDDSTNFGPPANQGDSDVSVGVKAGVGLAWQFHKHFALIGEYRFTHFNADFDFNSGGVATKVKSDINTSHLLAGISFRF